MHYTWGKRQWYNCPWSLLLFRISVQQKLHARNINMLMLAKLFSRIQLGCLFNLMDDMYMNIQLDKLFHPIPKGNTQLSGSEPHQYTWTFVSKRKECCWLRAKIPICLWKQSTPSTEISLSENTADIRCERERIFHPVVQIIPAGRCYCASIGSSCSKSSVRTWTGGWDNDFTPKPPSDVQVNLTPTAHISLLELAN